MFYITIWGLAIILNAYAIGIIWLDNDWARDDLKEVRTILHLSLIVLLIVVI